MDEWPIAEAILKNGVLSFHFKKKFWEKTLRFQN